MTKRRTSHPQTRSRYQRQPNDRGPPSGCGDTVRAVGSAAVVFKSRSQNSMSPVLSGWVTSIRATMTIRSPSVTRCIVYSMRRLRGVEGAFDHCIFALDAGHFQHDRRCSSQGTHSANCSVCSARRRYYPTISMAEARARKGAPSQARSRREVAFPGHAQLTADEAGVSVIPVQVPQSLVRISNLPPLRRGFFLWRS